MHTVAYVVDKNWCYWWYTEAMRMRGKLLLWKRKSSWRNWGTFVELGGVSKLGFISEQLLVCQRLGIGLVNLKLSQQWLADLTQVPSPTLPDPFFLSPRAKMLLSSLLLVEKTNWSSLAHVRRCTPPELKIETAGPCRQLKASRLKRCSPLGSQTPWNTLSVILPMSSMSLLCHNKGCGQHFDPNANLPGE